MDEQRKFVITPYHHDYVMWVASNSSERRPAHVSRPEQLLGLELAKHQVVKLRDWYKTGITQELINSRIRLTSPHQPPDKQP